MNTNTTKDNNALPVDRLVTDSKLAEQLSISQRHVHVLRARGVLRAVKLGSALRFPLAENLRRVMAQE